MIKIDKNSDTPIYMQIYLSFSEEIRTGYRAENSKMPSVRELAKQLSVSKNTIESAYEQLCAEGYIKPKDRSGYTVTKLDGLFPKSCYMPKPSFSKDKSQSQNDDLIDLSTSRVDETVFPSSVLRTLYREAVSGDNTKQFLCAGNSIGDEEFRITLAKHLFESRGVRCEASQIIVGAGTEYLLSIAVKLINIALKKQNKESLFAVENPGYEKTKSVILDNYALINEIDLDENGLSIDKLKESKANVVYCTPAHEYPLGITMPVSRRSELLVWAYEDEGRYVIEDDYDSDYRYQGNPIPALQGLDTIGRVLYIGTFSRSLSPSIRVSYLVLPEELINIYYEKFSYYSCTVSRIEQSVLSNFITQGHFERHISRTRKIYEERRDNLIKELKQQIPQILIFGQDSGLHFIARLPIPENMDSTTYYQLIRDNTKKQNLLIGGTSDFLLFCYAHSTEQLSVKAVQILKNVIDFISYNAEVEI